jgi:hypothetical protein
MADEKACFVIAPIGEADSETRKRSDQVLKHIVRPAVLSCGYSAIRADEIDKPGIITSQVIQHIVNDPLVVADLTDRNPNVFYELAIRHALRRPFVQLIKKGERIPFDVAGTRTINVDHRDLDSVESAKIEIIKQVKALEKDASDLETPISVSLDLQLLRQSEKPEERSLADLVAAVVDLRAGLGKLESKIGTQDGEGILDEIQKAVQVLPRRLDEYFDRSPFRRGRRVHPGMLYELSEMLTDVSPGAGILVIASAFRDAMPWVYELGVETYRSVRSGSAVKAREALSEFKHVVEFCVHGPFGREYFGDSKELSVLMRDMVPMLDGIFERIEKKTKEPKSRLRGS